MKNIVLLFLACFALSCRSYTNLLLQSKKDDKQVLEKVPQNVQKDYVLSPFDELVLQLFTNNGVGLVQAGVDKNAVSLSAQNFQYDLDGEGFVKLPILKKVKLAGLTIQEAETFLEKSYADYYVEPFVSIAVKNRRVLVFAGRSSMAKVINLQNNNMSLLECIAQAGGVVEEGISKQVMLLRLQNGKRKVYKIDLSDLASKDLIDIVVQNNDVIYIQPSNKMNSREVAVQISPYLNIVSILLGITTTTLILLKK